MPVAGRPLLGIWLDRLARAGCAEAIVNLHHHAGLVRDFVTRSPYASRVTLAPEEQLLGTAGTLLRHRERLSGAAFLFAHADNLSCFDPGALMAAHAARPNGALVTMMTFETDAPQLCGIVERDKAGLVTGFHEKVPDPPGRLANAAVYAVEPEVFSVMAQAGRPLVDFSVDVVPRLLGRIFTFHNAVYHRDIGALPSLLRAQLEWPLVAGPTGTEASSDPWYGMMHDEDARLAGQFLKALDQALSR